MNTSVFAFMVTLSASTFACGGLGFEVPQGQNITVVAEPNYTENIAPIMRAQCDVCHASTFPGSGDFVSNTYDSPSTDIMGVFDARFRLEDRCLDFEPTPMPPSSLAPLSIADRENLRRWILSGAPR